MMIFQHALNITPFPFPNHAKIIWSFSSISAILLASSKSNFSISLTISFLVLSLYILDFPTVLVYDFVKSWSANVGIFCKIADAVIIVWMVSQKIQDFCLGASAKYHFKHLITSHAFLNTEMYIPNNI